MAERGECGFALLIVLWTLVLVAFIVVRLTAAGRTEIRIADNLIVNAQADAAVDGAIYQTVFDVAAQRAALDGRPRKIVLGGTDVTVWPFDEAARINPNLASPALLAALFEATGSDPQSARQLTAAIGEWIGKPVTARPDAAVAADYRAAGRTYLPPGSALQSLDELGRVLGMNAAVLAAVRPHLSLFSGAIPRVAHADAVVLAALAAVAASGATGVPPPRPDSPAVQTARLVAVARGPGNAAVTRTAVVRIDPRLPSGYAVLGWDAATE